MLSVVITTHHDDPTCYLTAFAIKSQVPDAEIVIVADGGTQIKWENQGIRCIRGNWGSPQGSRDAGIRAVSHNDVLIAESHIIISDIDALHRYHDALGSAITFPIRRAESPEMFDIYAHETNWDGNLWYKKLVYKPVSDKPYRVAQFGNSCFMLDRQWYLDSGGYTDLMQGWGGEEPFICLKAWMLGRECWQVPSVTHYHWLTAGAHAFNPYLENNLKILRYVIAGRQDLMITQAMAAERQRICAGPFGGDLDKLRSHLKQIGAVC